MYSRLKQSLFAFFILGLLFGAHVHAALVPVPALQTRVTDLTQTLHADQQAQLESTLAAFEQETGSQIAVLIVPTTQPEAIEQFSIRVVDSWKLGRKQQDDGVLLLVAKNDRKMRIEVGYGLEGAIPDVIAKRIIAEIMAPYFRQGDFYGGILQATGQIMRLIKGERLPSPQKQISPNSQLMDMLPALLIAALVAGGMMRAIFGKFLGGLVNGSAVGLLIWILGGGLLLVLLLAAITFVLTFAGASNLAYVGGMGGGGYSRSGGWSGGAGGGFGGGGASGSW